MTLELNKQVYLKTQLPRLTKEVIENLNSPVSINKIDYVLKILTLKETPNLVISINITEELTILKKLRDNLREGNKFPFILWDQNYNDTKTSQIYFS